MVRARAPATSPETGSASGGSAVGKETPGACTVEVFLQGFAFKLGCVLFMGFLAKARFGAFAVAGGKNLRTGSNSKSPPQPFVG